jgi:regulator of replication initiation timing
MKKRFFFQDLFEQLKELKRIMGKVETKEISDHIKLTIENGKILSLKTHKVSKSVEENIQKAIELILDRLTHATLVPTLYTIIKELAINACKANQKRIFFEERGFDITNPEHYSKGLVEYKASFSEAMSDEFGNKAKKKGYYCLINFNYNVDGITVEVVNNTPIAKQEEKSIREKLEKGMGYDDIAQFYMDNADNAEGAGLGLALILIMLKGEGIDPNYFRIIIGDETTTARLEIPLSLDFKSKRTN